MTTEDRYVKIGDFSVERVRVGEHTLAHAVIDEELSIVFKAKDDDWTTATNCWLCIMEESRGCRDKVCPPGTERCADKIRACVDAACRGRCNNPAFGGGDYMYLM
jgi:hypothetical protein